MKIAITGGNSFLMTLALRCFADLPGISAVHVFDLHAPHITSEKIIFHKMDITLDDASEEMSVILKKHKIETFVHAALFSGPTRHRQTHHELESIGTFHVLNACAGAHIRNLIVNSATFVYGALPGNPTYIKENYPLSSQQISFVKTRVDVENQIEEFADHYPECRVMVLRFAPILGPNSTNIRARYFLSGVVPTVLGSDPLLQFIHEEDALRALLIALESTESGIFNIVGKGVIALSMGVDLADRILAPFPSHLCKFFFTAGYLSRIWNLPHEILPYFRYLCVGDGEKAEQRLGFSAQYSSRQALKSIIEAKR